MMNAIRWMKQFAEKITAVVVRVSDCPQLYHLQHGCSARAKRTLFSAKSARTLCERTARFSRFFIPLCFEIES